MWKVLQAMTFPDTPNLGNGGRLRSHIDVLVPYRNKCRDVLSIIHCICDM
jgi:hypothetical protein